mmetsp:Transcript_17252/g.47173  ORF Transcript_17252/g.47173 Transcript_17252/m.47173 type:complete len:386 (+) Transcript_17252:156-1313(+)
MKVSKRATATRTRRARAVGISLLLSLHRHFLFFSFICFALCCHDAPSKSKNYSPCFACVAAIAVPDEEGKLHNASNQDEKNMSVIQSGNASGLTLNQILVRAGKRGLGGGVSGALAGVVQVVALMWLRTITNYQCRYGTTFRQALQTLLNEGGIRRLYKGLAFALIQAPITRFVSTAANDSVESALASFKQTRLWGPERTTIVASLVVGFARILLMPIDTMKTVLQVDSLEGFRGLMRRLKMGKFMVLYEGAAAVAIMGVVGHYPWFMTYNFLHVRPWLKEMVPSPFLRNAFIGFMASIVSDTATNVFRVVKTTKQVTGSKNNSSYAEIIRMILAADGWKGLFGRGLRSRLASNALQSILFTVCWRGFAEWLKKKNVEETEKESE